MTDPLRIEECRAIFATAIPSPLPPEPPAPPKPPRPRLVMPGQHLDIFPATLPADALPPLQSEPIDGLFPPIYMFGWRYDEDAYVKRYAGTSQEPSRRSFRSNYVDRFYGEHPGIEPPDVDADDLVPDEYVVFIATNILEVSLRSSQDRARLEIIQSFLGETDEPLWYRRI
ncbi:hypothetical protein EV122DRAFT_277299 [Schizophyllum commune]